MSHKAGDPLSRAAIAAMTSAEFVEHQDEVDRWVRAGAVDGQAVPPVTRPEGHTFTRDEIAAMSTAEFEANRAAIDEAARARAIT